MPLAAALRVSRRQMARRAWSDAARTLEPHRADPLLAARWKLARNLAACEIHRPELAQMLSSLSLSGRYELLSATDGGLRLLMVSQPGASPRCVQPVPALSPKLEETLNAGRVMALNGLGDGSLLAAVSRHHPKLFMDAELAFWVIEPDPEVLLFAFMLEDFTGPDGPIEQRRIQWLVGSDWPLQLGECLAPDSLLPDPGYWLNGDTACAEVGARLDAFLGHRWAAISALGEQVQTYYRDLPAAHWTDLLGPVPPRAPRVLFLTSRFTTVLRHVTADLARTFSEMGYETRTVIETEPYHRQQAGVWLSAIKHFRPDLLWVIDHLRSESPCLPPALPYVCWIMDIMPQLLRLEAGASVGKRDFVLSFNLPLFTDGYGYPAEQGLDMPLFLARPVSRAAAGPGAGPDLLYVSNASAQPHVKCDELLALAPEQDRPLVQAALGVMTEIYARGGSLPNQFADPLAILDRVIERGGWPPLPLAARVYIVESYLKHYASLLYRQQGLRWVAQAALALGLELAIHGQGWEAHPDFAPWARGPVESGPARDALVERSRINFYLECYPSCAHARLLDGLKSGGFFLQRELPMTVWTQRLVNFLDAALPPDVETMAQARARIAPEQRGELDALLAGTAPHTWLLDRDPVKHARSWQRMGVFVPQPEALPHLAEVSFHDAKSCRARIERFIGDAPLRQAIAARQCESLGERLDYQRGVKRVLAFIRERMGLDKTLD